jgi:SAM-dependent methyltransferase
MELLFTPSFGSSDITPTELALYGKGDLVRLVTRTAIRRFVSANSELMLGKVLDFGAGKAGTCAIPQPYRSLLPAGAGYVPWEPGDPDPRKWAPFDAILCTQVLQNVEDPAAQVAAFRDWLKPGGWLVMTYPAAWEEIESEFWRFTKKGAWLLCHKAGLNIVTNETIGSVVLDGCLNLSLVNGMVAQRPIA